MINVRNEENWHGYKKIIIETYNGAFEIFFLNNGDLYWSLMYVRERLGIPNSYSFVITKENEYLYNSFERLYTAIKDNKPFSNSNLDDASRNMIVPDNKLFINGKIEWHSDELPYEEASILTISKKKELYIVEFRLSDKINLLSTHSIRICNSGSRYYPYNVPFMNMYNELLDYNYAVGREKNSEDNKKKIKKLWDGNYDYNRW